jgi:hypothetical protein
MKMRKKKKMRERKKKAVAAGATKGATRTAITTKVMVA